MNLEYGQKQEIKQRLDLLNKDFYVAGCNNTIKLSLRRTLVQKVILFNMKDHKEHEGNTKFTKIPLCSLRNT